MAVGYTICVPVLQIDPCLWVPYLSSHAPGTHMRQVRICYVGLSCTRHVPCGNIYGVASSFPFFMLTILLLCRKRMPPLCMFLLSSGSATTAMLRRAISSPAVSFRHPFVHWSSLCFFSPSPLPFRPSRRARNRAPRPHPEAPERHLSSIEPPLSPKEAHIDVKATIAGCVS